MRAVDRTGAAAASLVAGAGGLLALSLANLGCELSAAFKGGVFAIGKGWIPGAEGIGPYSGKETIGLVVWLVSWLILHRAWCQRDVSLPVASGVALVLLGVATTLLWPPVIHFLVQH